MAAPCVGPLRPIRDRAKRAPYVMSIAGERPETGVRIELTRPRGDEAPWTYAGAAHLPDASHPVAVVVAEDGRVEVTFTGPPPTGHAELAEKVRLIVRTAYRQAKADEEAPPLRIVRWRGEK